ncbi:MAG: flippase [Bacteroidales bacterium]|nr:flippase [Bacteroidales bacterium]
MIKNKVVKNSMWIISCKVAQSVLAVIINMLTARYLGPSNYGLINYAASIVAFVIPIMQLGLNAILVQEIINKPEKEGETLGTSLVMSLISAFLCIIGVLLFSLIANAGETETIIVCFLYSILLIFSALELTQYWFQAKLMSKYVSLTMLLAYILVSGYKIFLLATGKNIYWFAISNALDYAIISVVLLIIYKKISKNKLSFSLTTAKSLFNKGKYYIVSSMMVTIFAQTARIMLKFMISNEAVGYYSAAVACAGMTSFVFTAIIDSFRPLIFESKKNSQQVFEKNVTRLYSVIIYFALAQSVFIAVFSEVIVKILYGSQYIDSVMALRIIVWHTTFSYLGAVRNIWILAEGKHKILWVLNLSGALFNIILNFVFIPIWGIYGAALSALLTQIFTNVVLGFIIKPIKDNNKLMLQALNVKNLIEIIMRQTQK